MKTLILFFLVAIIALPACSVTEQTSQPFAPKAKTTKLVTKKNKRVKHKTNRCINPNFY
jgi:uncharacterized lipoprotein YajG